MRTEIYLDNNATTTVLPAAVAAAAEVMGQRFGNPSSGHAAGLQARAVLDQARARAKRLLGVGTGRLMFNSGATEGIQTAMLSALVALRERRARGEVIGSLLLYGATEHKAVPESLAHWNRLLGLDLSLQKLSVDGDGRHDLSLLRELAPQAALVCTMAANNETGVISDLAGIEAVLVASNSDAYWLVDCVQALGKLELDLSATRIDYAPFSGHKLYAPKGVGMLYVRDGAPFTPLVMGGGQEGGLRSGTENMSGIAALDTVLAALERGDTFRSHAELEQFRARLAASLCAALPGLVFNHAFDKSLPTTLNFSVPGLASRELMDVLDAADVRVSSGSACSTAKAAPSYVLDAMQLAPWRSSGAIRMSFGALIDDATIADACLRIERCGEALRASCLIPAERGVLRPGEPERAPVLQLGVDGACSWLLLDAGTRQCIVIDPLPEHTERIAAHVRCLDYRIAAVLGSSPLPADMPGRQYGAAAGTDDHGWPLDGALVINLTLADGTMATGLALGKQVLVRVPAGDARCLYLLGTPSGDALPASAVRFAFGGAAAAAQLAGMAGRAGSAGLAGLIGDDTLLCPSRDEHNQFCSSLRAQAALPADAAEPAPLLDADQLGTFLLAHPDALLVDVREAYEFAATMAPLPGGHGRAALSVPLGQLAGRAAGWLQAEPAPLVFFCRSGARSAKAAQLLRRLGHDKAWSLAGGVALAA